MGSLHKAKYYDDIELEQQDRWSRSQSIDQSINQYQ